MTPAVDLRPQGPERIRPGVFSPDPPELYLFQSVRPPFLEERRKLIARLRVPGQGVAAQARAVTDLAELHLAHAMAPEGLSLLASLQGADLPPAHRLRAAALELALGLVDRRDRPLTDRAAALLGPAHVGWADQPLFLALWHLRHGEIDQAAPILPDAVQRLARFPRAVQARFLPELLECAVTSRQWRLARDLAAAFDSYPALRDGTAYHLLLGRVAEQNGDLLGAFDSYARAMDGRDLWAHRARRAMVDLGLRSETLPVAEAITLYTQESRMWRGDGQERQVLDALATLQMIDGRTVEALETYGRLIATHPGTAQSRAATQKAHRLMEVLYADGAAGRMPLGAFMAAHRRAERIFRFDPVFSRMGEVFADTFLAAGATGVAAREYSVLTDYLIVTQDLGLDPSPPERMAGLKLKEAQALLNGGRFAELGQLLASGITTDSPGLHRQHQTLAARYFEETGQRPDILTDVADAPLPVQRVRARSLFEQADWAAARDAYVVLWDQQGVAMAPQDAIKLLLAAYRSGDLALTARTATAFPDVTDLPGWAEIAQGLTTQAPDLWPLSEDLARARMDNARQALDRLPDAAARP
ncbi:tetratricopeptide repeat protein [Pseudooceanicola aestuarii]|uniref:tetratricopeptide repeat protein n=1 Tax=Pseudooceanicola aestuarii TaxID=2697319 RepID=UPI0013D6E6B1|nr:hypothetical protein [Pseudooceanicola aestuarii]